LGLDPNDEGFKIREYPEQFGLSYTAAADESEESVEQGAVLRTVNGRRDPNGRLRRMSVFGSA